MNENHNEEKLLQGGFVAELVEHEGYYRYVEDQEQNLPFGGVAMNFVEVDGEKGTGHDDGEPLGPPFEKPETESVGEKESRINETANSDAANGVGSESGGLLNEAIDIPLAGIHAEHPDPMGENRGNVRMNETESPQADGDQNTGF